jgi:hypothetical protein
MELNGLNKPKYGLFSWVAAFEWTNKKTVCRRGDLPKAFLYFNGTYESMIALQTPLDRFI